jgi:hypothetical protein
MLEGYAPLRERSVRCRTVDDCARNYRPVVERRALVRGLSISKMQGGCSHENNQRTLDKSNDSRSPGILLGILCE